ncbi:MAG TPA: hypothetical protein VKU38_04065 [Ktedonobacteraceae bacterium]|nr:hypothetical protein [Ktedonobacteraceae bacterium]
MYIDMLLFWAFTLTVCAFALFVHSLLLLRKLIHTQHLSAWKMLTVVLSVLVSIWSLFMAFGAFSMEPNFSGNIIWGHFSLAFYIGLKANIDMATVSCQVQTAIVVAVFIIGAYLERKMFPIVKPAPQWVTVREGRPTR